MSSATKPDTLFEIRWAAGHLLLGVVRIYSRKVKYLYQDCTEAAGKIKMAFRPAPAGQQQHQQVTTQNAAALQVSHFGQVLGDYQDVLVAVDAHTGQGFEIPFDVQATAAETGAATDDWAPATLHEDDDDNEDLQEDAPPTPNAAAVEEWVAFDPDDEEEEEDDNEPQETSQVSEIEVTRAADASLTSDPTTARLSVLNQTADSSKAAAAAASPGSFPDDDDQIMEDDDDEPPPVVLEQYDASWMNLSRDDASRNVSVSGLEDDDAADADASNKRKSSSIQKRRAKTKRRKIQIDDHQTELDNAHMRNNLNDTEDLIQTETSWRPLAAAPVDWHKRLLQPAVAHDGHLAPALQQLWAQNLVPAHGKPFPYPLLLAEQQVEVARQQQEEEEKEHDDDDQVPLPDDNDEEEEEEENQVEVPFPDDDDEAPPMPDDFEDMEAMHHSGGRESSLSLGLVNDALEDDDDDEEDRQQAGDEAVSATAKWHKHTVKVLHMLQRNMPDPDTALSYDSLAKGCSRRTAAGVFFELLQLKTWDFIELDQQEAYGDITVTQGVKFDQKPPAE